MKTHKRNYIDLNSHSIRKAVQQCIRNDKTEKEKLRSIFNFVRDEIEFAFLPAADLMTASEVLQARKGQCNNKTILFHTMCKVAGLESRMHFSTIKKEIHYGLFKGVTYALMPKRISHSWIEIRIDGHWAVIDNYINDLKFYEGGKAMLKSLGRNTGFSVSCAGGESSPELDLNNGKYVQMGAVVDDHGTYDDPNDYFASGLHKNNPNPFKMFIYKQSLSGINHRIQAIRDGA